MQFECDVTQYEWHCDKDSNYIRIKDVVAMNYLISQEQLNLRREEKRRSMVGGGGGDSKAADISFAGTFASSAFAACFAEICTIPLDTAKVRLQLQKKAVAGDIGIALPKYKGMLGTVATIAREEGLASLWKGIVPGLHRQCLFGGLRIGLYEPIKNLYVGDNFVGDVPLTTKILAGLTTGALAISVANPTDLVKVRLQAEGKLAPGVPRRYSGALNAYSTIVRQEGVRALWTGLGPNVARNAIINAAELASYDQVKQVVTHTILKIPGFTDNVLTHLLSGLGAGFVAVCVGSPVDVYMVHPKYDQLLMNVNYYLGVLGALAISVANPTDLVKVRLQAEGKLAPGVPRRYSGALNAYSTIVRQEGVRALWTGLGPNVARNAIINAAELASYDQVKQTILKIPGFTDNVLTHLLSGLGAGFVAVCVGSPVDVVKSRMMGDPSYKGTIDCFVKTLKNDGPFAFYKGFIPNFGRLGSWNVIMFLTLEQAKKFVKSIESA
ncbi:mitochondrial uncoupling protein 1 [Artemisia annua]|uniref:Mitochondrial uncoupling protein 1 n=1 Tax=Artemisia annua TaxID=35608 RepID=A0A2U1PSY8_ARTAN|nr:mitochondrial uncoupling protein 1 [Artemisia annua]